MNQLSLFDLQQTIGMEFLGKAPRDGWSRGTILFRSVGKISQAQVGALDEAGKYVGGGSTIQMMDALLDLRRAYSHPQKGTWLTAKCTITPEGRMSFDFDYDNEPQWDTPIAIGHYLEEWEQYPRSPEYTPAWLAERLAEARARAES